MFARALAARTRADTNSSIQGGSASLRAGGVLDGGGSISTNSATSAAGPAAAWSVMASLLRSLRYSESVRVHWLRAAGSP